MLGGTTYPALVVCWTRNPVGATIRNITSVGQNRRVKFKCPCRFRSTVALPVLVILVSAARAQFSISSFTVDGGGGASSGGVFSIHGTLGQADAGRPSGGPFTLTGGFWAAPSIEPAVAPRLFIAQGAPGFAIVSWMPPTPGFVLEFAGELSPTAWTNASSGATNPTAVSLENGARFYRLRRD